jgi:hypothetical protein
MNRRMHLMMRIDDLKERTKDPVFLRFFSDTSRVLELDEEEITDLISRVNFLEQQLDGYVMPLPEYDPDDGDDEI